MRFILTNMNAGDTARWLILALILLASSCSNQQRRMAVFAPAEGEEPQYPYFNIPVVDLAGQPGRISLVDRKEGVYLGHPTTLLLEDNRTILCVYPEGHGRGPVIFKKSIDGGLTWSERLETPESWKTSMEVPTLYRTTDPAGSKLVLLFSGLYPGRMAISEDDGVTWSELDTVGNWGGIVFTSAMAPLATGPGHYMTFFHDDRRFYTIDGDSLYAAERKQGLPPLFTLYKSVSRDGGRSWERPGEILSSRELHLCEPGIIRSPDGSQLAILLRENSRSSNSQLILSDDEGQTWSSPVPLPNALTGDRHVPRYAPDGRLVIFFRDRSPASYNGEIIARARETGETDYSLLAIETGTGSPTEGDWVAWVGSYDDLVKGGEGQYRIRIGDNKKDWDTTYPGVELLPDGTFVTTTYGHWEKGAEPYIISVRFRLEETDSLARLHK